MAKATTPKAATADLSEKLTAAYETATENLKATQAGVREFSTAAAASGRATFDGIVEIDRVVLENLRSGVNDTIAHSRALLGVSTFKAALDLQQEFVSGRVTAVAEQTKALAELSQTKVREAWAPLLAFSKTVPAKVEAAGKTA